MSRLLISMLLGVSGSALAQPCTELPILFIVQDKSGSMAGTANGNAVTSSNPTKWNIASQVVPQMAAQFANRFRYGMMMYPGASTSWSCTLGGVVQSVPASAGQVANAYSATGPGGGTPTAGSLQAVRTYLQGLNTSAPVHVLLITDGLPNCNLSANTATCSPTTPGCQNTSTCSGASCCGWGAKDCLDDQGTIAAAAALRAMNVRTYVVGFDHSLTGGHNKAVLDAIAAAGGTSSAYVASNQAALSSALNQIAQNTSTCCQNACTQGASRCGASGQREECRLDSQSQCTNWVSTQCPPMSACSGGSCVACTNQCSLGASQCANDTERTCVTGAGGCTEWRTVKNCGYGEVCTGSTCGTCQACSIGAARCVAGGIEECSWNVLSGCTQWNRRNCPSGSLCANGSCNACNSTCTAGATRCTGRTVERCVADASGCTSWAAGETCTTFCSGGACGTCGTSCANGSTRCNGNGVETCGTDTNNCPVWGPAQQCQANASCAAGACVACATTCTEGARRCGVNGTVETCALQPSGCRAWVSSGQCDTAQGERCDLGACIPPCANACNDGARRCTGSNPQRCEVGPTGCTIWRDEPSCSTGSTCIEGDCFSPCSTDEFESCPSASTVCTGLPQGKFCLPTNPGGGSAATGGGTAGGAVNTAGGTAGGSAGGAPAAPKAGGRTSGSSTQNSVDSSRIGATGLGCGCASVDSASLLLAVLMFLRRR